MKSYTGAYLEILGLVNRLFHLAPAVCKKEVQEKVSADLQAGYSSKNFLPVQLWLSSVENWEDEDAEICAETLESKLRELC